MGRNNRETIAWCAYCKNEIYLGEDFVVRGKNKYHIDCYGLIKDDTYAGDEISITETDDNN